MFSQLLLFNLFLFFSIISFAGTICSYQEGSNIYHVKKVNADVEGIQSENGNEQEKLSKLQEYIEVKKCQTTVGEENPCLNHNLISKSENVNSEREQDYRDVDLVETKLQCESLGVFEVSSLQKVAERANANIGMFYAVAFPSVFLFGLPMLAVALSDRFLDTHIVFSAQDGLAANSILDSLSKDVGYYADKYQEFEEKLLIALAAAKAIEANPNSIINRQETGKEHNFDREILY